MAATQGVSGYDTKVYIYDSSWTQILEPKDISGPEITAEFADFTHMQSPSGFREQKPTYKSGGTVTFNCNYVHSDSGHKKLIAAAIANPPTVWYCKIVYPDSSQVEFNAYVSVRWNSAMSGPLEMAVTLTLSGEVVWAGASSPSVSKSASASASAS